VRRRAQRDSDEQLEALFGGKLAQRGLMRHLARCFSSEHAPGFEGSITFRVARGDQSYDEARAWTVLIAEGRARYTRETPPKPSLVVSTRLHDFVRVLAGVQSSYDAVRRGRAHVKGNLVIASRLDEMFRLEVIERRR
jgi:hypothetical protein